MIPCKDCLILPVCRNKTRVVCPLIWTWFYKYKHEGESKKAFNEMKKYLKRCFTLQNG